MGNTDKNAVAVVPDQGRVVRIQPRHQPGTDVDGHRKDGDRPWLSRIRLQNNPANRCLPIDRKRYSTPGG